MQPSHLIDPALTTEFLLKRMTGKGVKVAVIDSGVDGKHPDMARPLKRAVAVRKQLDGTITVVDEAPADSMDRFGHGTAVAGVIADIAPDCEILSVGVLDERNSCTGDVLIHALRWTLDQDVDVVNMSLALNREQYFPDALKLCEIAYEREITLVGAKHNMPGAIGAPAMFSSVISVDKHPFDEKWQFQFRQRKMVEFAGRGYNVRVPALGGGYCMQTGTSFATPQISGVVALLKQWRPDLVPVELKAALKALGVRDGQESSQPSPVSELDPGRAYLNALDTAALRSLVEGLSPAAFKRLQQAMETADPSAHRSHKRELQAQLRELRKQLKQYD